MDCRKEIESWVVEKTQEYREKAEILTSKAKTDLYDYLHSSGIMTKSKNQSEIDAIIDNVVDAALLQCKVEMLRPDFRQ